MTDQDAENLAKEILATVDRLIELTEKAEQTMKRGFAHENEVAFSHLRKAMQAESEGVHKSIGLLIATTIAVRYHRYRITETEMNNARGDLIETALWVAQNERPRKRKGHGLKGKPRSSRGS